MTETMGCAGSRAVAPRSLESSPVDRDEYFRSHPGLHNSSNEIIESLASTDVRGRKCRSVIDLY